LPNGQGAVNLVIQTQAPHQVASASVFGALMLFLLAGWRRRRGMLTELGAVLLTIGVGMGIAGCASPNPITGGTTPGTYQVAVTATTTGSGTGPTHSAVVTLTVKSLF
jgi:MYXO-CTERM domain-containing protein